MAFFPILFGPGKGRIYTPAVDPVETESILSLRYEKYRNNY